MDLEVVQSFLLDAWRRRTRAPATEASSPWLLEGDHMANGGRVETAVREVKGQCGTMQRQEWDVMASTQNIFWI